MFATKELTEVEEAERIRLSMTVLGGITFQGTVPIALVHEDDEGSDDANLISLPGKPFLSS